MKTNVVTTLLCLIVSLVFGFTTSVLASSSLSKKGLQQIQAASLLPVTKPNSIIRVGINPGLVAKGDRRNATIMSHFSVVACYRGSCQFAKPRTGLGFWEASFVTAKLSQHQKQHVLVVACSRLGCVKKMLKLRIDKITNN